MKVWVDDREGVRLLKAEQYFKNTEKKHLTVGDFVFDEKVVFEYKTIEDFISSVRDKRVFKQAQRMKEKYDHHFVVIETRDGIYDLNPYRMGLKNKHRLRDLYFGAIASLNTVTKVLMADNMFDCFYLMKQTSKKILDDREHAQPKMKSTGNTACNFLNHCVDGVGYKKAQTITEELDLRTLNDLLSLNRDNLTSIKGIGDKMADKILKQIGV